ncbi:MAG: PepSY domain-containing protein [Rhodobacteraceae bacterium]|nr:PepSY domain-containing protein [Paracoccaceae bacterium]
MSLIPALPAPARHLLAGLALAVAVPVAALALPAVGDRLGTTPAEVTAALAAAGCPVSEFEAETAKVEAECTETATGKRWEIYIDPTSGLVTKVEAD